MTALDPPGPELAAKNRRMFAELQDWPAGMLEACEQLDREHIGWYTNYQPTATPSRPEIGYYALRQRRRWHEPPAYGKTPEALSAVIATWPWLRSDYPPHAPVG